MLGSIPFTSAFAVQQWILKWHDPVFLHIFESITLKQIDLYCKTIKTHVLQIDWTLLLYYVLGDRNIYHVTMTSEQFWP